MKLMDTKSFFLICLTLNAPHAFAPGNVQPLEEIVVVANRIGVPTRQVASSVSSLTEEQILEYGKST